MEQKETDSVEPDIYASSIDDYYYWNSREGTIGSSAEYNTNEEILYSPLAEKLVYHHNRHRSWQTVTLQYLNNLREKANVPPLIMDDKLHMDVQTWANTVACKEPDERQDVKGLEARKFKIDLQHKYIKTSTRSKTELFHKTIDGWFGESKNFDCNTPITLDDVYSGAENFQKVGHYAVIMGKQYEKVGFGVALCPENDSVLVIARFDYNTKHFNEMVTKELENQNLPFKEKDQLDVSKFIACPDDFEE